VAINGKIDFGGKIDHPANYFFGVCGLNKIHNTS